MTKRVCLVSIRLFLCVVFLLLFANSAQAQSVTLSATSHTFGSVAVGATSGTSTVSLTNGGTATLNISGIVASANFADTTTCGLTLAAAHSCNISITFKPTALGALAGTVTITDNAKPATQTIALTGTGIAPIALTPASHAFGSVGEGTPSAAATFTVKNSATTAMPLTISATGPFAETATTCNGASVPASSSCTISVTFTPTAAGAQTGSLSVAYTGTGTPQTSTLTGTGVTPITITPTARAFGNVTQGTTSAAKTFTVKNITTATMSIALTSSNAEFAATGCGTSLIAGASCTESVTFTPTATLTGLQTGNIAVGYAGTGDPLTVAVQGTAVRPITVAPASIAFSTTRNVGTASAPHTVTITNSSATAVALGSIVASPAAYAITANTCSNSLATGSCTVTVVFTPTVIGTTTGTLTITYGTSGNQLVVPMMGGAQVNNLRSIAITMPSGSLATGASEQLTATGTYASGVTGNVTSVAVWSSSTSNASVVSTTGLATGVTAGSATITATVTETSGTAVSGTGTLTVTGKTLTGITLSAASGSTTPVAPPTLAAGTNMQLYATGTYSDGSTADITTQATWASSGAGAVVTAGLITAVSTGDPTISASLLGFTGSTSVTVTAAALQSIAITPAGTTAVAAGNSQQFTATGTYTDTSTQNITTMATWSSTQTGVTMSTTTPGLAVTSDAAIGMSSTISATLGSVSAATSATLTVNAAALVSIVVTPVNSSIASGTTEAFTATGTYSDGTTQNLTASVTWSDAPGGGAATFTGTSGPGVALATAPGLVMITATSGSVSGSTPLTVTAPLLTSIVVTSTLPAIPPVAGVAAVVKIYQGQTQQFYALGTYSDSSIQNITGTVAWSAGTGSVATVSTSGVTAGLATGVAAGTVGISATLSSIVSTTTGGDGALTVVGIASVMVTPATPTAYLGDANPSDPYGSTNNTLQFIATANYADGVSGVVTTSATWTSATGTVATIGSATPNQGLATVLTVGTSLITATYASVSGNTTLTVSPAILESITVAPNGVSLGLNGTQQFTATGSYSDGTTADVTSTATWASANTEYVTVGTAGSTPASTPGLATVIALATPNVATAITASSGSVAAYGTTNTAFVSGLSILPITCAAPTINMRLLVVNTASANAGAGYADFPAIQQILNYVGTPYDVVDTTGAAPVLSDGACHGYYQGVIFAYGGDFYNISAWQSTLISYEETFHVRQVNWFDFPDPYFGLSAYAGNSIPSTSTYSASFTPAAAPVFFYANTATPVAFSGAEIYLVPPSSANGTVTPLLTDTAGNALSVIITWPDGRQYLTQTFDSNPYLMHDLVVAYGLLNWVTKGVFLGDYHVYATQEIDDFFIDDSEWIPSTTCLTNLVTRDRTLPDASNLPVSRVDAADMAALVKWQTAKQGDPLLKQFELTIAMNGVGTTGNGDWSGLVAPIISSSAAGGVASFTAQDFSGLPGQTVTVTNTTNGGGVLNGAWTIVSETSSAATTPGTTTFTANVTSTATLPLAAENGANDNPATATAAVADDLVSGLSGYQGNFHWISHTYDHPTTLNGLCKSTPTGTGCGDVNDAPTPTDDIDLEILTNLFVASSPGGVDLDTDTADDKVTPLTFTDFNPGNIVTPGVTGLNDPNVPGYLYADGIRYAVSDTSVATITSPPNNNGPNPSPNVGIVNSYEPGIYEVPRHPNDVFYNVANWADDDAEFVCIYSNYVPPGSTAAPAADPPFNTYNAAQVLDFTSSAFVTNMLMGDMDPEMFHQPDLHFSDNYPALTATPFGAPNPPVNLPAFTSPHVSSLLTDTYDQTFRKYEAVYNLPVLTPTLDQLGVLMQNRNSFNLSGVTASIVGAGTATATITIAMPSTATVPTAVIPITGLNYPGFFEVYGGQNISHISMAPGQTITVSLP